MTLSERIQAAKPDDTRALLEDCYSLAFPEPKGPGWGLTITPEYAAWVRRWQHFNQLLHVKAYLDAAMMLLPEGWGGSIHFSENRLHHSANLGRSHPTNASAHGEAPTPALALLAAICQARGL